MIPNQWSGFKRLLEDPLCLLRYRWSQERVIWIGSGHIGGMWDMDEGG